MADSALQAADEDRFWRAAASVPDPEMPPLTIADLGILRSVRHHNDEIVVTITPTYSGCPAIDTIESGVRDAVAELGVARERIRIEQVLAPAWTTDWITDDGRRKLADAGISPPRRLMPAGEVAVSLRGAEPVEPVGKVNCPRCGSEDITELSSFSSTACKALYRCETCREPFDHVKEL